MIESRKNSGSGLADTATKQYAAMDALSDEDMRRAVSNRDPAADGTFVYGVVTTGIYCRPSCPSRSARSDNLRFFGNAGNARAAGFRACRRCDPDGAGRVRQAVLAAAASLSETPDAPLRLAYWASRGGISTAQFRRRFKALLGVTPKAYHDAARLAYYKQRLRSGARVTDAVYDAGFGSSSRVYGERLRNIGMTPAAYRAGGAGEEIRYAGVQTTLGTMLVAATERGVCSVQFGDDEAALIALLRDEFPEANCQRSDGADSEELGDWVAAIEAYLAGGSPRPDVPLDIRGTAFQRLVWEVLLSVPDGEVLSYTELASRAGRPRAVRAAAAACAANRIGVLIPCHRVLRADGGIGGYRWGVARKRALLDAERERRAAG